VKAVVMRATGFLVEPDHLGLESLAALAEEGRLRVVVGETFPLERAAEAHEYLQSGKAQGKVVLTTHPS
jgi:NADPH:quinone reductase-like Zn-dependent oxidoreductase